jgi:hypothetical protein
LRNIIALDVSFKEMQADIISFIYIYYNYYLLLQIGKYLFSRGISPINKKNLYV